MLMILIHTVKQQSKVEENGDFRKTNRQKKQQKKKKHIHTRKNTALQIARKHMCCIQRPIME